jgi:membrane protease YdiL (CAAX protease family)
LSAGAQLPTKKTPINQQQSTWARGRTTLLLLTGFCLAIGLRVIVGAQLTVASSAPAGLLFAACLTTLSWTELPRTKLSKQAVGWGLLGVVVLCVPVVAFHMSDISSHARPAGNYLTWSLVVGIVAAAEELFIRGKLYRVLQQWLGTTVAVIVGAVAFAGLHVPLYGWHVVPLDVAVGLWLGTLRYSSGSWAAPGIAHIIADMAAWWII